MAIPYQRYRMDNPMSFTAKWVFRSIGLEEPEYRTYISWYWKNNSDFSNAGISCPKCKTFISDKVVGEGLSYNKLWKSKIKHDCGATLVFLNEGVEI